MLFLYNIFYKNKRVKLSFICLTKVHKTR